MKKTFRNIAIAVAVIVLVGGITELTARWYLGLGDPPLMVRDSEVEYMFAPDRCYCRFGYHVCYNHWSMRSDPFPVHKDNPDERRVLVIGDSIINGGSRTDQSELATQRLQERLKAALHAPVVVGNISAGSWGPANQLAYLRRYGWFDADIAIFVFNSADLHDIPTFETDLGPDFPTETPILAIEELAVRYLPRYLPFLGANEPPPPDDPADQGPVALRALLAAAIKAVPKVIVVLHPTEDETRHGFVADGERIAAIAAAAGVRVVRMDKDLATVVDTGYRDGTHVNAIGQAVYADRLTCLVLDAWGGPSCTTLPPSPTTAPPPPPPLACSPFASQGTR